MQPDTILPKEPKIKIYSAKMYQNGSNAPEATILQNTLGYTPVWTRDNVGRYLLNLTEPINPDKALAFFTGGSSTSISVYAFVEENDIFIESGQLQDAGGGVFAFVNGDSLFRGSFILYIYQ